jgi:hypothetical protein
VEVAWARYPEHGTTARDLLATVAHQMGLTDDLQALPIAA